MTGIKNIVFDFGGVLVDWNPRYLFGKLFDKEEEMEYFLAEICNDEWNVQQDAGRSLTEATRILQNRHPEYKEMIGRYYDDWEVMLNDEIKENSKLIEVLKRKEYRLYGLTNWSGETFPIAYNRYHFFKEFDGIVVSGEEKLVKPDKRIFQLLLDRYGIDAADSLFIDDNIKNTLVAEEFGFKTIHFGAGVNLEKLLVGMGVL